MKEESMLLGFGFALTVVAMAYAFGKWVDAKAIERRRAEEARARARLLGADELVSEIESVEARRRSLALKLQQIRAHHQQLLTALNDFRGTEAEADFRARAERAEGASAELGRAVDRFSMLEAELRMQRAGWGLVRLIQEELSLGHRVTGAMLKELSSQALLAVEASGDFDVRRRMGRDSSARKLFDDSHERIRNHLAALRLRELDASIGEDAAQAEPLDALVLAKGSLSAFEEEMREIDAHTEAVLEVERMLA